MPEKSKILIIDDEADFSYFLKLNMELTGEFEVTTAPEGQGGIELARKLCPDLILLDIRMPGISGPEIHAILRQEESLKNTPVVFLSGLIIKEEEREVFKKEGNLLIAKPVTTAEIIDQIRPLLAKKA